MYINLTKQLTVLT